MLPKTKRPGRDTAEIEATVRAYELAVPVFVILPGKTTTTRAVRRAIVEEVNRDSGSVLITFIDDEVLPPAPSTGIHAEFELVLDDEETRWQRRRARPNQARFAFAVMARYGARCAVCDISASPVLEAAHVRPNSLKGSDDARNGLPLCSNHHRLFDKGWFGIDPVSTKIVFRDDSQREHVPITRSDLRHLPAQPAPAALQDAWMRWKRHQDG
ncbi:HNH endonuclease [Curtobacterium aetherium]|uniref:HNH endonuclease n=1 Tax=Curtobacterium aetherium TaxID=2841594 RepID=A0ACD1E7S0_9MICO|nr:HNH endonuclease [Curtobacterium sp. L6-1]QWS34918.1 HNH endonuclease [Curtobacterium sp. L6-1]